MFPLCEILLMAYISKTNEKHEIGDVLCMRKMKYEKAERASSGVRASECIDGRQMLELLEKGPDFLCLP
jgi:hypothetical protein